jgi:hypothetical protein
MGNHKLKIYVCSRRKRNSYIWYIDYFIADKMCGVWVDIACNTTVVTLGNELLSSSSYFPIQDLVYTHWKYKSERFWELLENGQS